MRSRLAVPAVRRRLSTEVAKGSTSSGPIVMPTNESSAIGALATGPLHLAATHVGGGLAGARWGLCVVIGLYLMIRPNEWKKVRPPPPPPLLSPSCFFPQPRRHFVALGPVRHEFAGANRPSAGANRTTSTRAASPTCRGRTRSTRRHSRSNTTCARQKLCPFSPRWRLSVRLGFLLSWAHFLSRAHRFRLGSF